MAILRSTNQPNQPGSVWFARDNPYPPSVRPRIPSRRLCAFLRSFSLTPTPSSIPSLGQARIIRPRYANRPMYAPSGRSRRNLLSSSAHPWPAIFSLLPLCSDGCSAPGTSFTSSGKYHPSVHGFILASTMSALGAEPISPQKLTESPTFPHRAYAPAAGSKACYSSALIQ